MSLTLQTFRLCLHCSYCSSQSFNDSNVCVSTDIWYTCIQNVALNKCVNMNAVQLLNSCEEKKCHSSNDYFTSQNVKLSGLVHAASILKQVQIFYNDF